MAAIKCLSVLHHSEDLIFISFGITEPFVVILKIKYRKDRGFLRLHKLHICIV